MSASVLVAQERAPVAETPGWLSAHYEQPFHRRRTEKLPAKLRALGVLDLPRDARILDTCCGKGEALETLRQNGFEHLSGADGCRHPEWRRASAARFAACDVRALPFADDQFDAVMNLHALHHLGDAAGVDAFLRECFRVLKPGGKMYILDFPGSPQINLLFRLLKERLGAVTPGLRNFARILDEEWAYLAPYLDDWPDVRLVIRDGPFHVENWRYGLFLYYLTLSKPRSDWAPESDAWVTSYTEHDQYERRRAEMPGKLRRLGVDRADRGARIYDLCCGTGEALEALYDMGFRDLHGADATHYPGIANDERFEILHADVRALDLPDASADWILNIHALHHLQTPENVHRFLDECYRLLKPGGRLGIVDFPSSPQIQLAFRAFLMNWWHVTPYLRWFGRLIQAEWHFLPEYLARWPEVRRMLLQGRLRVVAYRRGLFYYYLTLAKPESG